MNLSLGLVLGSPALPQGGPPQFTTINGVRAELLLGRDGKYLKGSDGAPLYEKVQ